MEAQPMTTQNNPNKNYAMFAEDRRKDITIQQAKDARLAASYLGSLAKGHKKTLTQAERDRRAGRLAEARKKRWPNKAKPADSCAC